MNFWRSVDMLYDTAFGLVIQAVNYLKSFKPIYLPPPRRMGNYVLIYYQDGNTRYPAFLPYDELKKCDSLETMERVYCKKNGEIIDITCQPGTTYNFSSAEDIGASEIRVVSEDVGIKTFTKSETIQSISLSS